MSVSLKDARAGQSALFRCGGQAEIRFLAPVAKTELFAVNFSGASAADGYAIAYHGTGKLRLDHDHPFDIVGVIIYPDSVEAEDFI